MNNFTRLAAALRASASLGGAAAIPTDPAALATLDPVAVINAVAQLLLAVFGVIDAVKATKQP